VPHPEPVFAPVARPPLVTAAGILLIVVGVLGVLGGLSLLVADAQELSSLSSRFGNVDFVRMARGIGFLAIVLAGLEVLAGALVLRRSNGGRILGIVLAIIGILGGFGTVAGGGGSGILVLLINGFVVYVLFAYGHVFDRARGG
jgi:hypothetical protein